MVPKLSKGGGKWEEGQQRPSRQHGMGTPVPSHWGSQSTGPKNMEVLRGTKVQLCLILERSLNTVFCKMSLGGGCPRVV